MNSGEPGDHEQIRRLIAEYALAVDEHSFDRLAELLGAATLSLTWEGRGIATGDLVGGEAIRGFYVGYLAGGAPTRHVITNLIIDVEGDTARVFSYITAFKHPPDGPATIINGHYEDRFERDGDGWRFREKRIVMELPA